MIKIRQGKDEPDEDYIDQVDEVVLSGEPISDELAFYSALGGFHGRSPLFRHLTKDMPPIYAICRTKAADFLARQRLLSHLGRGATE